MYGWYLVFGGALAYYIYNRHLMPLLSSLYIKYANYKKRKEDLEYEAIYHKDPDRFADRISAQQSRAEKLQEKYKLDAQKYQEQQKEKERKKLEALASKETGLRLGDERTEDQSKPKSFKPEYNPLMGSGSSSNYRPPKRSKCGGGGCGK